jgi:hypothetical protein
MMARCWYNPAEGELVLITGIVASLLSISSTLRAIDAAVHFDPLPPARA